LKLGARMLKTGIAVVLALYIGEWLNLQPVLIIVIAAVFATQPSIFRSYRYFLEQLQANTIGAILGYSGVMLIGNDPIVTGIIVIIVIIISILLKLETSIGLAILTVIIVMEAPEGAVDRFLLIMLGILISIVVNAAFLPPNHERNLSVLLKHLNERIFLLMRNIVDGEFHENTLKEEKKKIDQDFRKSEEIFDIYREEKTIAPKQRINKPLKLVIYRQMRVVIETEMDLILSFRKGSNKYYDEQIHESISALTQYHELIFMKFDGKIKTKQKHEKNRKVYQEVEEITQHLLTDYDAKEYSESPYHLLSVVSLLNELAKELDHLDTLVTSYNRFHRLPTNK
jgi:uncharacterized membrane protein YgaE (UPF0421/DUF939 family)